jgi:hypothetical protein
MTPKASAGLAELSFSVDGLKAREYLLFKSWMRAVTQKSLQRWLYRPFAYGKPDIFKADLRVIAEDRLPREVLTDSVWPSMLVLGYVERHKPGSICLPVNPKALENELNRQAIGITSARDLAVSKVHGTSKTSADTANTAAESVRLLRWPPPRLLGSPQRVQLATLMAGQAVTLDILQKRSRQSAQACKDFVVELQNAGLLYSWTGLQHPSVVRQRKPAILPPSLLARIRSRLGLQTDSRH